MGGVDPNNFENFRNQMKLKTLKDLEEYHEKEFLKYKTLIDKGRGIDEREWLVMLGYIKSCFKLSKREAIKWVKDYRDRYDYAKYEMWKDWFMKFFNITEEDLE